MDPWTLGMFIAGVALLVLGAEGLVRGSTKIAASLGVTPLIIGLTVVAMGTGSPEMAVSVKAAIEGKPDLTVGNVVGSNIMNILVVLGLCAFIRPLIISQQLVRIDVPIMILASAATFVMAMDGVFSRIDGAILFAGIILYTFFLIRISRKEKKAVQKEYEREFAVPPISRPSAWILNLVFVVVGIVLLVIGADWLVESSVKFAAFFGVDELIIGLTIVAIGTSLPELATSLVAVYRGERDIAAGNAIGSSIFNIFAVLGLAALVAPNGIRVNPNSMYVDIPVMLATAVACLPIFFIGYRISRWEGLLFVAYYAAYVTYLILYASDATASLETFNYAMLLFAMPITALTIAILLVRDLRAQRAAVEETPDSTKME